MRLIKYLTLAVAMSRNQAGYFIRKKRVSVDGKIISDPDFEILDSNQITFDGKPISIIEHQYIILNKPKGYVCATKDGDYKTVLNLLDCRIKESECYFANILSPEVSGLVLISDDIRWASKMRQRLQKKICEYQIHLKHMADNADLSDLLKGQYDSIASERVNENTLKLKTVHAKSAELIGTTLNFLRMNLKFNYESEFTFYVKLYPINRPVVTSSHSHNVDMNLLKQHYLIEQ